MVDYEDEGVEPEAPVKAVADILYNAMSPNWEIEFEEGYYSGAQAILDSRWLRDQLADAFDAGIGVGGRYGHEDGWDEEIDPYNENPYRTKEERELGL